MNDAFRHAIGRASQTSPTGCRFEVYTVDRTDLDAPHELALIAEGFASFQDTTSQLTSERRLYEDTQAVLYVTKLSGDFHAIKAGQEVKIDAGGRTLEYTVAGIRQSDQKLILE